MSATHTPGPWKAVPNPRSADGMFVVRDIPPQPYGSFSGRGEPVMRMPPSVIECQVSQADALLIAAAPDLLARLRDAQCIIENALAVMTNEQKLILGDLVDRDDLAGTGVARSDVRMAAIAKAIGA